MTKSADMEPDELARLASGEAGPSDFEVNRPKAPGA
jgi:hypothetical protein